VVGGPSMTLLRSDSASRLRQALLCPANAALPGSPNDRRPAEDIAGQRPSPGGERTIRRGRTRSAAWPPVWADSIAEAALKSFGPLGQGSAARELKAHQGSSAGATTSRPAPTTFKPMPQPAATSRTGRAIVSTDEPGRRQGVVVRDGQQAIAERATCWSGQPLRLLAPRCDRGIFGRRGTSFSRSATGSTRLPLVGATGYTLRLQRRQRTQHRGMGLFARAVFDAAMQQRTHGRDHPAYGARHAAPARRSRRLYAGRMRHEARRSFEYNFRFGDPEWPVLMMRLKPTSYRH